jgi:hypothetical protein
MTSTNDNQSPTLDLIAEMEEGKTKPEEFFAKFKDTFTKEFGDPDECKVLWKEILESAHSGCPVDADREIPTLMEKVSDIAPTYPVIADPLNFSFWFSTKVPIDHYSNETREPIPGECPLLHVVANTFDLDKAYYGDGDYVLEEEHVRDRDQLPADVTYQKVLTVLLSEILSKKNLDSGDITLSHSYGCEENSITIESKYGSCLWISMEYDNGSEDSIFIHDYCTLDLHVIKKLVEQWMEENADDVAEYPNLTVADYMSFVMQTWSHRFNRIHIRPSEPGYPALIAFSCDQTPDWVLEEDLLPTEPMFTHSFYED